MQASWRFDMLPHVCHVLLACLLGCAIASGTSQGSSCAAARSNSRRYTFQLGDYNATIIEDGALTLPIEEAPFAEPVSKLRDLLDPKFRPLDEVRALPSAFFGVCTNLRSRI